MPVVLALRTAASGRAMATHAFTLAVLAAWQMASWYVPVFLLPGPAPVTRALWELMSTPAGLAQIGASLLHVGLAMVSAFLVGTMVALLPYYVRSLRRAIDTRLTPFLNAFPGIGWTLLAIIWLGLGFKTVIFAVGVILVPFMIINIREGVRTVDRDLIEMAESFGANRWREFVHIVLPSLLPFMFSAIKVSFGVAWKVTLTAELFGGTRGLGYTMNVARQELETPQIYAVIVLIIAIVYLANRFLFDPLQRRLQAVSPGPV
jgi:NitT/TauT family transport system permease protein